MKNMISAVLILFSISCNNKDEKTKSVTTADSGVKSTETVQPKQDLSGCYQMVISKDTAYMELAAKGDSLSGPLSYRRFEKDSNAGTVYLTRSGDKANGWYVFQSEGKTSVREIAFLITDNGFAEAYGDVKMQGDSAVFTYPHTLKFEEKHPFVKVPCK